MNRSLLWLMVSATMAGLSANVVAEESCPAGEAKEDCEHPQWRESAAMSDDSRVLIAKVAENTERTLPKATVTLWALPPVPQTRSHVYTKSELKAVELDISRPAYFGSAKADLQPEMVKRISGLVEQLKNKRGIKLSFEGHTDNQPLSFRAMRWFADNQNLSEASAKAVAEYFHKA
jgi:flagellar motor protein MotB